MVKVGRCGLSFLKNMCRGCKRHLAVWFVVVLSLYSIFYLSQHVKVDSDNMKRLHRLHKTERHALEHESPTARVTELSWGNMSGLLQQIKPLLLQYTKAAVMKGWEQEFTFPWDDKKVLNQNKACKKPVTMNSSSKASLIINLHDVPVDKALCAMFRILKATDFNLVEDVLLIGDISFELFKRNIFDLFPDYLPAFRHFIIPKLTTSTEARKFAAKFAHGDVFVFMDLNLKVSNNWLEHILHAVVANPTKIVQPMIIRKGTVFDAFGRPLYMQRREVQLDLSIREINVSLYPIHFQNTFPKQVILSSEAFALKKTLYFDLRELEDFSGNTDLEMVAYSFKAWLCGDGVIIVPCAEVTLVDHVVMSSNKKKTRSSNGGSTRHKRNLRYLASIWLGPYENVYACLKPRSRHTRLSFTDKRSVKLSKSFYSRIGCKHFSDFVKYVQPSLIKPVQNTTHFGSLSLLGLQQYVSMSIGKPTLTFVSNVTRDSVPFTYRNSSLSLNKKCFTYVPNGSIKLTPCNKSRNQKWLFIDGKFHFKENPKLCMAKLPNSSILNVDSCSNDYAITHFNFTYTFEPNCIK